MNKKLQKKIKELIELSNNPALRKREREEKLREFGKDISLSETEEMYEYLIGKL